MKLSKSKLGSLILERLKQEYPKLPRSFLNHSNPFELLVATVLSAQCTDDRVNKATPLLFKEAPNPEAMKKIGVGRIKELIKSINFFNNKATALWNLSVNLIEKHQSQVPQTLEELVALPGVGRKTANVVLGNAFNTPGMVVDTHVLRISNRLKFSKSSDPEKTEQDLMLIFPENEWVELSHRFILLGRNLCKAQKTLCKMCFLVDICPSAFKNPKEWKN